MSDPKFHWLFAGQVVTRDRKDLERRTSLNALVTTTFPHVTRQDLANGQMALQHRFVTESKQVKGAQIVDVFILSISAIGCMTQEEFHAGFEDTNPQEAQNSKELAS